MSKAILESKIFIFSATILVAVFCVFVFAPIASAATTTVFSDSTMSDSNWTWTQLNSSSPATSTYNSLEGYRYITHRPVDPGSTGTLHKYTTTSLNPATDASVRNLSSISMSISSYFSCPSCGGSELGLGIIVYQGDKVYRKQQTITGKGTWKTSSHSMTRAELDAQGFDLTTAGQPIYVGFFTIHSAVFGNYILIDNVSVALNSTSSTNPVNGGDGACPYPVKSLSEAGFTSAAIREQTGDFANHGLGAFTITNTHEQYNSFISDANGNANSNGSYITVTCNRNHPLYPNLTNGDTGNNIDSVGTNLGYADRVSHFQTGTGLSGAFLSTNGYVANALGAPDNSITYMGDGSSSFTVGFCEALRITTPTCTSHASKMCVGNSVYWKNSCGVAEDWFETCSTNQYCSGGSCVAQTYPTLVTTATANPSSIQTGQSTTFTANLTGGTGTYSYAWSGDCTSTSQVCTATFNTSGTKTAHIVVTSGSQTASASASVTVTTVPPACTTHHSRICSGNAVYWQNSCNVLGDWIETCSGNQYCQNGTCQNNTQNCTYHSYQRCEGNYLYWYDSCQIKQDGQYCSNGCYNNSCQNNNNYNYYGNCTYHAYKDCQGNAIYWFGSCGTLQDLYQVCSSGQTCKYGQCVYQAAPVYNNYVTRSYVSCYNSNLFWFDSLGVTSGLYRTCNDNNSCTSDSCFARKCVNTLKCDGSTCANNSADYSKYCTTNPVQGNCGNGLCEATLNETNTNCPADCKISNAEGLAVSFFAKQNKDATQWQKEIQMNSNGEAYFMISAKNNSTTQIDNVNVSANIPGEIYSLGNLQVDGVPVSGDIVVGINVGSLAGGATKSITFEGKTQDISAQAVKQAAAVTNVGGTIKTDSVSIGLNPNVAVASVSSSQSTNGFMEFLKRWYGWIIVGLVLIFLFIIVFRRFSSES